MKQDINLLKKAKRSYFLVAIFLMIGAMLTISFSCFNNTKTETEIAVTTEVSSLEGEAGQNKPVLHFDKEDENLLEGEPVLEGSGTYRTYTVSVLYTDDNINYYSGNYKTVGNVTTAIYKYHQKTGGTSNFILGNWATNASSYSGGGEPDFSGFWELLYCAKPVNSNYVLYGWENDVTLPNALNPGQGSSLNKSNVGGEDNVYYIGPFDIETTHNSYHYYAIFKNKNIPEQEPVEPEEDELVIVRIQGAYRFTPTTVGGDIRWAVIKGTSVDNEGIDSVRVSINGGSYYEYLNYRDYVPYNSNIRAQITFVQGYKFDRWICDASVSGFSASQQTLNVTLNAKTNNDGQAEIEFWPIAKKDTYEITTVSNYSDNGVNYLLNNSTGGDVYVDSVGNSTKEFDAGVSYTICAKPNAGYTFLGWYEVVNATNRYYPIKIAAQCTLSNGVYSMGATVSNPGSSKTYQAVFIKEYTITIEADEGIESISGGIGFRNFYAGQQLIDYIKYDPNSSINAFDPIFEVELKTGIKWDTWEHISGTLPTGFVLKSQSQLTNLTMPASSFSIKAKTSVSATNYIKLIAVTSENGVLSYNDTIVKGGQVNYYYNEVQSEQGTTVSAKVMATDKTYMRGSASEGYRFLGWYKTISGNDYYDLYSDSNSPFLQSEEMPASNENGVTLLTYYAIFEKEYALTINKDSGISSVTGAGSYIYGEEIDINATLLPDRLWAGWNLVSGQNPQGLTQGVNGQMQQTIIMGRGDVVLEAKSSLFMYGLTVQTRYTDTGMFYNNGGGTVRIGDGASSTKESRQVELNSSLVITAKASIGYKFLGWYKNISDTAPYYFNPLNEQNIMATSVSTEAMPAGDVPFQEDVLLYYAIFAKEYTYQFTSDFGIASQIPAGAKNFYFGQEVNISATVKADTEYEWAGWKVVSGVSPTTINFEEREQTIVVGGGNCTIRAITTYTTLASYALITDAKYTNVSDNKTLILGKAGGTLTAPLTEVQYGNQIQLTAIAIEGFELFGIYKYDVNTITGNTPWRTGAECNLDGLTYTTLSEPMSDSGQHYYAVFQRVQYVVTTDVAKGTDITINGLVDNQGYFGQTINYEVVIESGYENLSIKVYKTGTSEQILSSATNCTMPAFAITIKVTASPILYGITFNPNGGAFSPELYSSAIDINGNMFGGAYYQTNNYVYYIDSNKLITQSGVPTPNWIGYKIVSWNTQADGNGIDYITYSQTGVPTYDEEWNNLAGGILYAIYELADFDYTITQHTTEFVYDGLKHNVLTITINNFIDGKTYSYKWLNSENVVVFETESNIPYNTLQLRSVNQSDVYCCEISLEDEQVSEKTTNYGIEILKQELTLSLGDRNIIGDYAISYNSTDLTGLVAGHTFVSGYSIFKSGKVDVTYSEIQNKSLIVNEIILQTLSADTGLIVIEEDGSALIENYNITYNGQVIVTSPFNFTHLMVGAYERTVDEATFEDVLNVNAMTNVNFDMTFSAGFTQTETYMINGIQHNYIDKTKLSGVLTLNLIDIPENYKFYKLFANDTEISNANITITEDGVVINMDIIESLLLEDLDEFSYINIYVYLTKQALVIYDYGFEAIEISGNYATFDGITERVLEFNSEFVKPENPTRAGFVFKGWFYDNDIQVGDLWKKTGTTTIYAKWQLAPLIAGMVELLVYDNEVRTYNFTRDYNGNSMRLDYELQSYNPVINYSINWSKFSSVDSLYKNISIPNIKNVVDSGQYSFSLNATYNTMSSYLQAGLKTVQITISQVNVSLIAEIIKMYDATTNLTNAYFIDGVNGEQLRLNGNYVSADVNIVEGEVSSIALTNLGIESYGGAMIGNYKLTTTEYSGLILPYIYEINENPTKVYDGNIYSAEFNKNVILKGGTQTITFVLETTGANSGVYKPATENGLLLQSYSVKNAQDNVVSSDNYNVQFKDVTSVVINKADISDIFFTEKIVSYNGAEQINSITNSEGVEYDSNSLPENTARIDYYIDGQLTSGVTDAGIYEINAKIISNNQNYNDMQLTARFIIEKAKLTFEFLKGEAALAEAYAYTGIDIIDDLTINAINDSETEVTPEITNLVKKYGIEMLSVVVMGNYTIEAIYDTINFEPTVLNGNIKEFSITFGGAIEDVVFNDATTTYSGINLAENFVSGNLVLPEGITSNSYTITLEDKLVSAAKNVGVYTIRVNLFADWELEQDYIEATLTIEPFVITNANTKVNAVKTYDGTTVLPTNSQVEVTLSSGRVEKLGIEGSFTNANAGIIEITIAQLLDYQIYLEENYVIDESFKAYGEIEKKVLDINLYKEYFSDRYNTYIQVAYTGNSASFTIGENNFTDYVEGLVNNEYIYVVFETLGTEAGKYTFSDTIIEGKYAIIADNELIVYNGDGTPTTDGRNNYLITVSGGLEIIELYVSAELTGQQEASYTGEAVSFGVTLTLQNIITGINLSYEYNYSYDTGMFMLADTGVEVPSITLAAEIRFGQNVVAEMIVAGVYNITLLSEDFSYIFNTTKTNQIDLQFEVAKAEIEFDFGELTVVYGNQFSSDEIAFDGQSDEQFFVTLSYDTSDRTNFNVGNYDLATLITAGNYTIEDTSTGDIDNYQVSLAGILAVTPRLLQVNETFDELDLTYNGTNHIEAVNNCLLGFTDVQDDASITLNLGTEYFVEYCVIYTDGDDQVRVKISELKNSGYYYFIISSVNYKFDGGTENVNGRNEIMFEVYVNPTNEVTINLDEVKFPFTGNYATYEINKLNSSMVTGLINDEYIVCKIVTSGSEAGVYQFGDTEPNCYIIERDAIVYDQSGKEIINGFDNYAGFNIIGGIEIVKLLTNVEFVISELDDGYTGFDKQITVNLTTEQLVGEDVVVTLTYDYVTKQFYNGTIPINNETLSLYINDMEATSDNTILNAGTYTLRLQSGGQTPYVFASSEGFTHTESDITVDKYTISPITIYPSSQLYGHEFVLEYSSALDVVGVNGERLYLDIFGPDAAGFNVGTYEISSIKASSQELFILNLQFDYAESPLSTGLLENYIIEFTGELEIAPNEIVVETLLDQLTYNGTDRKDQIKDELITFKEHHFNENIISLVYGEEYEIKYYSDINHTTEITDVQNVGTYYLRILTTNYELLAEENATGEYANNQFYIDFTFEIYQANVNLYLCDPAEDPYTGYILMPFTNSDVIIQINKELWQAYDGNAINSRTNNTPALEFEENNGEYVVFSVKTFANTEGAYGFDTTQAEGTCFVDGDMIVYNSLDEEVLNGINNYNITIYGGIQIVNNLTIVEFVGIDNLEYTGLNHDISVKLTTPAVDGGEPLVELLTYNYADQQFYNGETALGEKLAITLKSNRASELEEPFVPSTENGLISPELYNVVLTSGGDTPYLFAMSGTSTYSTTIYVDSAQITFDIGEINIIHGDANFTKDAIFTGVNDEIFDVSFSNAIDLSTLQVGTYNLINKSKATGNYIGVDLSLNEASTGQMINYDILITGTLIVESYAINVDSSLNNLELTYNGKNQSIIVGDSILGFTDPVADTKMELIIDEDYFVQFGYYETLESTDYILTTEVINAQKYAIIVSSQAYRFVGGEDNIDGEGTNVIIFNFVINPATIEANLYFDNEMLEYILIPYTGFNMTYEITKDNYNYYISNLQNGEQISFVIKTESAEAGLYQFENNPESLPSYPDIDISFLDGEITIYDSQGNVIVNGNKNYTLNGEGGIQIAKYLSTVEFLGTENYVYNATAQEITVKIETEIDGITETETFIYNYETMQFMDGEEAVNAEKLSLLINGRQASLTNTIKNAGSYTLTLDSGGQMPYTFASSNESTHIESGVIVNKAALVIDLGDHVVPFHQNFSYKGTFNGLEADTLSLIFYNSNISLLNTGTYSLNTEDENSIQLFYDYDYSKISTGDLNNYIPTLTGTLTITPREVSVTDSYGQLELVYNGLNQINAVKNIAVSFKDEATQETVNLIFGQDYDIYYPVEEFVNVGEYVITIRSQNYKLTGNETAGEQTGETGNYYFINYNVSISKASLNILLYDEYSNDGDNENDIYLRSPYTGFPTTVQINKDNNYKYIFGIMNNEYLVIDFLTMGAETGVYPFSTEPIAGNSYFSGEYQVFNSQGFEIVGGSNNYDVTVEGGIEILTNLTTVEFEGLTELIYSGKQVPIRLTLTTEDVILGETIIQNFVYNYGASQFEQEGVAIDSNTLALNLNEVTASADNLLKNQGAYVITLISNNGEFIFEQTGGNTFEFNTSIGKADIVLDLGNIAISYGSQLNYANELPFIGENNEEFYLIISYDTTDLNVLGSPHLFSEFLEITNIAYNEDKVSADNLENNYNITFEGELIINAREIEVIANYDALNLVYNEQNQIESVMNVEVTFKDVLTDSLIALEINNDYTLTYSNVLGNVTEITNAGTYFAIFNSANYNFVGSTLSGDNFKLVRSFVMQAKNITVNFTIEENLVYNNEAKNPVSYEFDGAFENSSLNELLLYSNGQVSVKNAGVYTASISISNSNYALIGIAESQEFTISAYGIVVDEPTEIYFSKHFGENDPILSRDITLFNETVAISFDREAGEQVGQYALMNPSLELERNNSLILNNYEITNSVEFEDNFKAFEIIIFGEETGTLIIKQISNIITTYNATSISNLDFASFAENFIITYNDQQLSSEAYELTATLVFSGYEFVRNAGNYVLALGEASSTSHLGEITLETDGFEYIIQSVELDIEKVTEGDITKQYDKLSSISVDGILNLIGLLESDNEAVELQAVFIDEAGNEAYNIGNYTIFLSLTGDMKDNYSINPEHINSFTGNITVREITVEPASGYDESAFDKEYDKTSSVNTGLLNLVGVLSGDYVAFSGEYLLSGVSVVIVGNDYDIEFTTDNPNYVILNEGYKGDINTRQLTISEGSTLTKQYDESTALDVALITLERIINGDDVTLAAANFVEATEGLRYVEFTLGGEDALNYHIENTQGEILSQLITVKFHYGDEDGVYLYNFVADEKIITKPQDEYSVIYGTSLNDIRNGMLDMPIGNRDGYTQAGWFTDVEKINEFLASTEINSDLADFEENGFVLDLYADWTINTYEIVVEIQTEEIANKNFKVNAEGGYYSINTTEQQNVREKFVVNYYEAPTFTFVAAENFTFDGLYSGINKVTTEQEFTLENVAENLNLVIKFARNTVQVQLNLGTNDIINGLTTEWNYVSGGNTAVRDVKFGEAIILPSISRIGYTFTGYALTSGGELEYSTSLGMNLTPEATTELYAVWNVNSYKVYFDYADGTETTAYERASEDENGNKFITIDYNTAIGELPILSLDGFEQGNWIIKLNDNIISSEINFESVWNFTNAGDYTLTATWTAGENTFVITNALNTSLYTQNQINDYETYEDAVNFTYKINDIDKGDYSESFTAKTGETVQVNANIISPYYEFLGWKINETTLISGNAYEIDEVTYQAYGEILIITDFAWGIGNPTILAEYTPFAVEILQPIYNINGGTVELVSGFFEADGVNYTLTGAHLVIGYSVNENYHLEDFAITNADFTEEDNNIIITNFYKEIGIEFNFVSDAYNFTIKITGEESGLSNLMYSINDSEYVKYIEPTQIHKFDTVKVKLIVNYGYISEIEWQLSEGGDNIALTEGMSWVEGDKTVIENEIFGFDSAFTLTINLDILTFNVSTDCAIVANDIYELDTTENQSMVTDSEGTEITLANYLTNVTFKHIVFAEGLTHEETNISAEKYDFIGWFELDGDHYILISDMPEYTFAIESDVNYTAVFKLKTFELTYNIANDASYGKVTDSNGEILPSTQFIAYGEIPVDEIIAEASNGCDFTHWNVTYTYNGTTVVTTTLSSATLQPEAISGIANFGLRSDVNLEAVFETKDITVNMYAKFIDGSEATEKIDISYGTETSQTITASVKTYEEIVVTASTLQMGYTFVNWQIIGDYKVTSAPTQVYEDGKLIGSTIGITFIGEGDSESGEYSITANFDSLVYTITTSIVIEGNELGGGEVFTELDNPQGKTLLTSPSQVGTIVEIFVYIKVGYNFDVANPENWLSATDSTLLENVIITVEELELSPSLQNLFSNSFKISLSEFVSDIDITIDVNRDITTFIFKDKVDNNWVTCDFTATIKYDTNEIIIDDINSLILSRVSYEFKGWSVNSDIIDIYITASGEPNFFKWQNPASEITLYAIWEELSIKLDVKVEPISATQSQNYYPELFGNLLEASPTQLGNEYYFEVGSTFGISLPRVAAKFSFIAYEVLVTNGEGGFIWDVIPAVYGVTEFDRELFTISAYEDYIYTNSDGSGIDVSEFDDGTIYIKLIYGIKVNVVNKNYYNSGNDSEIGGSSLVNGKIVNNAFRIGETISVNSVPASGYLFKNWIINGVEFEENERDIVVDENTTCEAVYIGKPVQVTFKSNIRGEANEPTGGNIAITGGIEYYHVGDVLYLSATAITPYKFSNVWEHNKTGQFTSNKYIITSADGAEGMLELEPLFSEAIINLYIEIEGSQGSVSSDIALVETPSENKITYSATLDYTTEVSITISANEKFKYSSIWLIEGTEEIDVSNLVNSEGIFTFTPAHLSAASEFTFKIRFEKLYWYDYVIEKGFITVSGEEIIVNQDFIGSGKASDPYLIKNIDDYALWAYVINNNVIQQDSDRLPYNTDKTYYKVINSTIFNERYWTPIGTSENPFKGHAGLYADYAGITVDVEDANYPMSMFDEEVLEEYKNLFGYLAETAVITFEAQSNMMLIIILSLLLLIIIILVIIILNTVKKRKRILSSVYQSLDKTDINNDYDE